MLWNYGSHGGREVSSGKSIMLVVFQLSLCYLFFVFVCVGFYFEDLNGLYICCPLFLSHPFHF